MTAMEALEQRVASLEFQMDYILKDLPCEKNILDEMLKDVPGQTEPFNIVHKYAAVPNPGIGQWQFRDQMKNYKQDTNWPLPNGKKEKE
jgi:hypothetical protein